VFLDLDFFKPVNDSEGHGVGDQLLQVVAERLLGCVRNSDTVCRYGGDEFVILLADMPQGDGAISCADKMLAAMNESFQIGGKQFRLSASIGVANYPEHAQEAGLLVQCADIAMYQAKCSGRNRRQLFAHDLISAQTSIVPPKSTSAASSTASNSNASAPKVRID
jgi:diguanylate cyclase (GGDEF)-like protein